MIKKWESSPFQKRKHWRSDLRLKCHSTRTCSIQSEKFNFITAHCWKDEVVPNNEIAVVILGSRMTHFNLCLFWSNVPSVQHQGLPPQKYFSSWLTFYHVLFAKTWFHVVLIVNLNRNYYVASTDIVLFRLHPFPRHLWNWRWASLLNLCIVLPSTI